MAYDPLTPEQIASAKTPEQLLAADPTLAAPSITSASLAPTASLNFQSPNTPPIYPVASLDPNVPAAPMQLTAPEQQATDVASRLASLNQQYTGQSAYQADQEKAAGIPQLNQTVTDLSSRLTGLKNEALAIPLQLQNEATGRGITAGGLQPLQTAALRNNAIQALSVNSLLEASRGNLSTAMDMVDRAVAQKFDPIKEQIAANQANLDLILKSPAYSIADKNRAQAQKDIQDRKARDIAKQEENTKTAQAMAAAAVKLNPNNPAAALAAQQLLKLDPSDPQYLEKAFAYVGQYQADPQATRKALDEHLLAQAQIGKMNADAAKARATVNDQGDTIGSLAQQLVNGMLAPSDLSKRTSGAGANYNSILTAADKLSMATTGKHFDIAKANRDYKYASNKQTQDTLNYLGSLVGTNGQTGNLDELVNASNNITRTTFPALNNIAAWSRYETGDPAIAAFHATATEVADQVAKILQGGGTGSGTSDAKLRQAQSLFQTSFSKAQIQATVTAIKPLLVNRAKNIVNDNPYLSDYADSLGLNAASSTSGGTTYKGFTLPY